MNNKPRMLVIGTSNIGDTLLTGDVIAALAAAHPQAPLALVVGRRAVGLFEQDPRVQQVWGMDDFDGTWGRVRLLRQLRRFRPDIVVDLRHTVYPFFLKPLAFWRYLKQPPPEIVHMRERHRWKLAVQAPRAKHEPWIFPSEVLWFSEKEKRHVEQLWQRWKLDSTKPVIIFCPGARSHIKRWTAEGFAAVADRLIEEHQAQVVFSGESEEGVVVDEILQAMRHPAHRLIGLITMRQLGLFMQRASLVITNDSASLHMASLMDAPTVAIFGPTNGHKYGPRASHSRLIRRRLFCSPCEAALCRYNHECMRYIKADEVYEASGALLKQQASGRGTPSSGNGSRADTETVE